MSEMTGSAPTQPSGLFEQLAEQQLTPLNEGVSLKRMRPRLPYAFDAYTELEGGEPTMDDGDSPRSPARPTNEASRIEPERAFGPDVAVAAKSRLSTDAERAVPPPTSGRVEARAAGERFAPDRVDAMSMRAVTSAPANAVASFARLPAKLDVNPAPDEQVVTNRIVERLHHQTRVTGHLEERTNPASDRRAMAAARPRLSNDAALAQRRAPLAKPTAPESLPSVEIHIGRIEIRADARPAASAGASAPAPAPTDDRLGAYLRARNRGSRS